MLSACGRIACWWQARCCWGRRVTRPHIAVDTATPRRTTNPRRLVSAAWLLRMLTVNATEEVCMVWYGMIGAMNEVSSSSSSSTCSVTTSSTPFMLFVMLGIMGYKAVLPSPEHRSHYQNVTALFALSQKKIPNLCAVVWWYRTMVVWCDMVVWYNTTGTPYHNEAFGNTCATSHAITLLSHEPLPHVPLRLSLPRQRINRGNEKRLLHPENLSRQKEVFVPSEQSQCLP